MAFPLVPSLGPSGFRIPRGWAQLLRDPGRFPEGWGDSSLALGDAHAPDPRADRVGVPPWRWETASVLRSHAPSLHHRPRPCRPPCTHHATPRTQNAPRSQRSSAARALSARPPRRSFIAQETRLSLPPRGAKLKQRGKGESEGHHNGKSPSPQNPNVHWAARAAPARTSPRPSGTI